MWNTFNTRFYNSLHGFVSTSVLNHIADKFERVKAVGINSVVCGCKIRTHGLSCACELGKYSTVGNYIPLQSVHSHWKRLTLAYQGLDKSWSELSLQHELDVLNKRFQELDLSGKIIVKTKLREIAYPYSTSMCPPPEKVRTKGAPKVHAMKFSRSTKHDPSYFEHVDSLHSVQESISTRLSPQMSGQSTRRKKA